MERGVKAAADALANAGISATPRLLIGDPKYLLPHEARRMAADCVFLGAKGHGRIERLLLGSVSATVAARAECSVEVVRQVS